MRARIVLLVAAALLLGLVATLLLWRPGPWPPPVDTGEWRLLREERIDIPGRKSRPLLVGVGEDGAVAWVGGSTLQGLTGDWETGEIRYLAVGGDPVLLLPDGWCTWHPDEPRVPWVEENGVPLSPVRAVEIPGTRYRAAVVRTIPEGDAVWKREVGRIASAAMSEDGRRLFLGLPGNRYRVFDLASDRILLDEPQPRGPPVVAFTPHGRRLLVSHREPLEKRWRGQVRDVDTSEMILETDLPWPVNADPERADFDRSGRLIALAAPTRAGFSDLVPRVVLIDVETGETADCRGELCDPRGSRLAVLDRGESAVRVVRPGPTLGEPIPVPPRAFKDRAARGARWLALWVRTRREPSRVLRLLGHRLEELHGVVLVDLEAERVAFTIPAESVPRFAFSPSGRVFAVLEIDGRLRVWRREGAE